MIKEGVLNDVDEIYGIHLFNTGEVGKIYVSPGPITAGGTGFNIKVKGKGGHGALPHETRDAT